MEFFLLAKVYLQRRRKQQENQRLLEDLNHQNAAKEVVYYENAYREFGEEDEFRVYGEYPEYHNDSRVISQIVSHAIDVNYYLTYSFLPIDPDDPIPIFLIGEIAKYEHFNPKCHLFCQVYRAQRFLAREERRSSRAAGNHGSTR